MHSHTFFSYEMITCKEKMRKPYLFTLNVNQPILLFSIILFSEGSLSHIEDFQVKGVHNIKVLLGKKCADIFKWKN